MIHAEHTKTRKCRHDYLSRLRHLLLFSQERGGQIAFIDIFRPMKREATMSCTTSSPQEGRLKTRLVQFINKSRVFFLGSTGIYAEFC
jgi:hypothetical protein